MNIIWKFDPPPPPPLVNATTLAGSSPTADMLFAMDFCMAGVCMHGDVGGYLGQGEVVVGGFSPGSSDFKSCYLGVWTGVSETYPFWCVAKTIRYIMVL